MKPNKPKTGWEQLTTPLIEFDTIVKAYYRDINGHLICTDVAIVAKTADLKTWCAKHTVNGNLCLIRRLR